MSLPVPCKDILAVFITELRAAGIDASSQLPRQRSGPHVRVSSPGNRGDLPLHVTIMLECFAHSEADSFALAALAREVTTNTVGKTLSQVAILGAAASFPVHFNTTDDDFHRHQIMCEMTVDPR